MQCTTSAAANDLPRKAGSTDADGNPGKGMRFADSLAALAEMPILPLWPLLSDPRGTSRSPDGATLVAGHILYYFEISMKGSRGRLPGTVRILQVLQVAAKALKYIAAALYKRSTARRRIPQQHST